MVKQYKILFLIVLGVIMIFTGCGGGEKTGSPGSDTGDTGILITAVRVTGEEPAGGDDEIDVHLHLCPPEFTELEEGLFMANALFSIDAESYAFDPFPATVEQCDITYLKGNENPDAPVIENMTVYPNCTISEGTDNSCRVVMMDVDRKRKFWDDMNTSIFPQTYPVHFTVRFSCEYLNSYGENGSFQTEYDIWLADWNYC